MTEPCKDCRAHSGHTKAIDDLATIVKDRGAVIASKLSSKWFTWIMGILIFVVAAIFAVLWNGQGKIEASQLAYHKEVMQSLATINSNAAVAAVKAQSTSEKVDTIERKVDHHILNWPTMPEKVKK